MKVLVAVPIFNEEKFVAPVLREIRKYTRASARNDASLQTRVLVIDDGSTDNTPAVVGELANSGRIDLIIHAVNRGYGQSLIDAFQFAAQQQYDWIITMDCDEQHEPCSIPLFINEIKKDHWGGADIISGSRYLKHDAEGTPPRDRRTINHLITELLNSTLDLNLIGSGETPAAPGITDAFCGFKAHRVAAMQELALTIPGYAFPMQFWVQAAAHRLRIRELPVKLIYKDATRHFGGLLDDPTARLQHYLAVLTAELKTVRENPPAVSVAATTASVCAASCEE